MVLLWTIVRGQAAKTGDNKDGREKRAVGGDHEERHKTTVKLNG